MQFWTYIHTLWLDFNINGQIGFNYPLFPHILHSETHFFNIYLTLPSLAMVIFWLIHPSRVVKKHLAIEFEEQRKPHHSEWHLCSSMRTHPSTIMETIKRKRSSQAAFTFTEALLKLIYLSPAKKVHIFFFVSLTWQFQRSLCCSNESKAQTKASPESGR